MYNTFSEAKVLSGNVVDFHEADAAIKLYNEDIFMIEGDKSSVEFTLREPVQGRVLEIAFPNNKRRTTNFNVDVTDGSGKKSSLGAFDSSGTTTSFEKFLISKDPIEIKSVILSFNSNSDKTPIFAVKGIRLAKDEVVDVSGKPTKATLEREASQNQNTEQKPKEEL